MTWTKNRAPSPGELEFHLASEPPARKHDEAWRAARAAKLARRHH